MRCPDNDNDKEFDDEGIDRRWKTAPMAVRKNKKWGQLTQNNFTAA